MWELNIKQSVKYNLQSKYWEMKEIQRKEKKKKKKKKHSQLVIAISIRQLS